MAERKNVSAKVDSVENVTVSSSVLSDLFSVSDRRIRQLTDEGIVVRIANGRYDLVSSVKNYIKTLKINNYITNAVPDEDDDEAIYKVEQGKHERIKRKQAELKLALMKGEMHKASDVMLVMNDMLTSFRSRLLNIPSKMAPLLLSRNEVGFIKEILTNEIIEVLNELKNYDPKDFYGEEYIDFEDEIELSDENE